MNEERVATLKKLIEMDPQDTFSVYALGLEYLEGEPTQAQSHFEQVLKLDPRYVAAYFQLGKLNYDQGAEKAATEWLEKGIAVAEEVGDTHAAGEMQDFLDQM
ncbi:tetratricopeptide repeat protein [bacterium]|nr:tetratricopeptide repeat protein [bacterium]